MNTILAHLKKDIISCRALLWMWVICVGVDYLCFLGRIAGPHFGEPSHGPGIFMSSLVGLLTGAVASYLIQFVLLLALVVRIIHEDALVDPDAFWRTRPIPRSALLAEKALLLTLLLTGTLLAALAMGIRLGSPNAPTLQWLRFAAFFLGLAAFSAVTATLSRLILTFAVIGWGAQVLAALLLKLGTASLTSGEQLDHSLGGPLAAVGHVRPESFDVTGVYFAGFLFVIVWQYLTLRTNISRAVLAGTFLVAALLGHQ